MYARRLVAAAAYALTALFAPAALRAQGLAPTNVVEDPRGLYYHLHGGATEMTPSNGSTYFGYGGGGQVGYNVTRFLGLFVGFDMARPGIDVADLTESGFVPDDNFLFTHVEMGGRVNLPTHRYVRLLPYADVAYARRALSYSFAATDGTGNEYLGRLKFVGNNVLVGGGVQLFLRPTIAADFGARVSLGQLDHVTMTTRGTRYTARDVGESGLRFSRVNGGITWYYPGFQLRW